MSARTWPDRPLSPGLGPDERSRPPGELLDNLRLRLSQLAGNHPSAPDGQRAGSRGGGRPDGTEPHDGPAGEHADERAEPGALVPGGEDGEPAVAGGAGGGTGGGLHSAVDYGPADPDAPGGPAVGDGSPGGRRPGQPGAEPLRAAANMLGTGLAALATMELPGRGRRGDPYRPWFMAGEPGSPWWAGTGY